MASGLSILSLTIVPWLGVPLAGLAALVLARAAPGDRRKAAGALVVGAVLILVAAAPALGGTANFARVATGVLQSKDAGGNLPRPLDPLQLAGIWPRGDFRVPLVIDQMLVHLLIALTFLLAAWGAVWLAARRKVAPSCCWAPAP